MTYADNTRHYGLYIDGDIAKLPGGGRKGAAVLCELLPDQLAQDPNKQPAQQGYGAGPQGYGAPQQDPYGRGGYNRQPPPPQRPGKILSKGSNGRKVPFT